MIFLLFAGGCSHQQFKTALIHNNDNEGWGPNALTWNGRDLLAGESALLINMHSIETGYYFAPNSLFSSFSSDGFYMFARTPDPLESIFSKKINICGLAWEGECCSNGFLWLLDGLNREIYKMSGDMNKMLHKFPAPADNPHGLVFDGRNLWVADAAASKIYQISTVDGRILREFNSPVQDITGLAWDCNNIWVLGMNSCKQVTKACTATRLVKLNIESGKVTHEIGLPAIITRPTSIVWVDGIFWVGDHNMNRVFKIAGRGSEINDPVVYASPITRRMETPLPPETKDAAGYGKAKQPVSNVAVAPGASGQGNQAFAGEAKAAADEAKDAADKARKAADEAQAAALEAQTASKKSVKAFELQQRK
ncbi:MAG: hypothetical protein C0402_13440 [Thermodesulfovibrio sp.]|nr:hypothetical protein [Thermodesulfovibrio sp.]